MTSDNRPSDLIETIIRSKNDEQELQQAIDEMLNLVTEQHNKQALMYLGSLLRQTTSTHQKAKDIATKKFIEQNEKIRSMYEKSLEEDAKLDNELQWQKARLEHLQVAEKVFVLSLELSESKGISDSDEVHELVPLYENINALKTHIVSVWSEIAPHGRNESQAERYDND